MNILLVDDEAPARARLKVMVEEMGSPLAVIGEAANGAKALEICGQQAVDLVLMDISMPVMDGLESAAQLALMDLPPAVVFVTAYDEHALEAFEGSAVDYLLKPIRKERLQRAIDRAQVLNRPQLLAVENLQKREEQPFISVSYRGGVRRILLAEVIYFRADQKYVTLRHPEGELLLEQSLKSLEEQYGARFLRIHRNALIARDRVVGLEKGAEGQMHLVLQGVEERLEVSRRHLPEVRRWIKKGE